MKNLIFLCLSIALIACEKESEDHLITNESPVFSESKLKKNRTKEGYRYPMMYKLCRQRDENGNVIKMYCDFVDPECFPTVVVTGLSADGQYNGNQMQDIINSVRTSSQTEIVDLFSNNEAFLKNYIDSELVDEAIAGEHTILSPPHSEPNLDFITFGSSSSLEDITKACQFEIQ